jgi:tRNA pseudouridine38-40 synthase
VSRSLWHPRPLDVQRLQASAAMLVGEHDFRAFTPTDTQHQVFVRSIEDARWYDRGDTVELEITADSFLRHMVRILVGTMLEQDPDALIGLLQGAQRAQAGSTAAPSGLYLTAVHYDD